MKHATLALRLLLQFYLMLGEQLADRVRWFEVEWQRSGSREDT
jgi:hypothetical protein